MSSGETDKWLASVNAKVGRIASDGLVFLATTGTMVEQSERVWGRGLMTNGQPLTYQEDYAVYVYAPPFPRKGSGRGKPNSQGKSQKIKGGYYATYLAAKTAVGRGNLPFELTGQLRKDYLNGAQATPTQDNDLVCTIRLSGRSALVWKGMTQKKGNFLGLTTDEKEHHVERLAEGWNQILRA